MIKIHYKEDPAACEVLCKQEYKVPQRCTTLKSEVNCKKCLAILDSESEGLIIDNAFGTIMKYPPKEQKEDKTVQCYASLIENKSDYKQEQIDKQKIIINYLENRIEKLERCLHDHIKSDNKNCE